MEALYHCFLKLNKKENRRGLYSEKDKQRHGLYNCKQLEINKGMV